MATMATMATPKLKLEKRKMKRGVGEDDNQPTVTQKIFSSRGWSAGVAMDGGHGGDGPKVTQGVVLRA